MNNRSEQCNNANFGWVSAAPYSLISTWQNLIGLFATAKRDDAGGPRLETLEDRILYDASPLSALVVASGADAEFVHHEVFASEPFPFEVSEIVEYPTAPHENPDLFPLSNIHLDLLPTYEPTASLARQLVVVDDRIVGYEELIADITLNGNANTAYDILTINQFADGIDEVSSYLDGGLTYEAIHIVAHGRENLLQLGAASVSAQTVKHYADEFAGWARGLESGADILIYGCDIAASAEGRSLVDQIGQFTGADVAASEDLTGHALLGGDWQLEYHWGVIDVGLACTTEVEQHWVSVLAAGSSGTAIWAESGSNTPEINQWDGASFGTEANAANVGQWRIMQGAEAPTRDEVIIVGVDTGGTIEGQMWDGSTWSPLGINPLGTVTQTNWWGMDVAYESGSGNALLVWTDGATVEYATWDGTSWSSVNTIGAYSGATPRQIELAASPDSDEMVLVVSDSNSHDRAFVWDGSTWGNAVTLATNAGDDRTDINVAYEQQSGRAMVVYSDNTANDLRFRMWDGVSWSVQNTLTDPTAAGAVRWTTIASDPNSDRIAVGVVTFNDEAWFAVWDGSSWGNQILAEPTTHGSTFPNAAVAFESNSGDLLAIYAENTKDDLRYQTWSSSGGWSGELKTPDKFGDALNSMTLSSDPFSNDIMLALQDDGSDLNYVVWNGSSWESPSQQEIDTGEIKNQPFLYLWDQQNADTAVLTSVQDTYITLQDPGFNYGVSTQLIVDRESTDLQRALVQFDLSSIPVDAIIHSATLNLEATAVGGTINVGVYQVLQSWAEGTANGSVDDASWTNRGTSTPWTTAGGYFDPAAIDLLSVDATGEHSWIITALVQNWVDGTDGNYGVVIASPDGGGNRTVIYESREGTIAPELIIHYSIANAAPIDISPNIANINEHVNTTVGYSAATLSTTDPDVGDTFTYSIVGGTDAAKFTIGGTGSDELILTDGILNYETKSSYSVIVRTTDAAGAWHDETLAVNVNDLNDAPTLDNSGSMQLANVLQSSLDPTGELVATMIASAGGDRITDVDSGAVEGIAVTAVDNSNGVWEYSTNGGGTWTAFGGVTDANSVVLTNTGSDKIRFVPNTGYTGNSTITFRAWDRTDGNLTGTTGVVTTGGSLAAAFSVATETASIYVEPTEVLLWASTTGDIGPAYSQPNSGVAGLPSWSDSSIIGMGDPNLSFGSGTTTGTFGLVSNFDTFAGDGETAIIGLHVVTSNITVSGAGISGGSVDLLAEDLIFVTGAGDTLTTAAGGAPAGWTNNIVVTAGDVYVFRAENQGDYSSGYFRLVMNGPGVNTTESITLVEQSVTVGNDTVLAAGDFLFSQSGNIQKNRIYWYDTSVNNEFNLIDGDDINIGAAIFGLELIESGTTVGGVALGTGDILVTINATGTVGDNNLAVNAQDVFVLHVTATTLGSGTAAATAEMFFDGNGNANFDNSAESLDAISLIILGSGTNQAPVIGNSGSPVNFIENGTPVLIDSSITVADADSTDFAGGILSVDNSLGGAFGDRLSIFNQGTGIGQVGISGSDVTYNFGAGAVVIGSFTGGSDGPLVVNLNANANATAAQTLMRNVTFWNNSENPVAGARTIDFVLTDGDGGTSSNISQFATVTAAPDAPVAVNDKFGLDFDGTDDYVAIAHDAVLTMTNSMTMEAWIYPDASANANRMIINKEGEYEVALFSDDRIYWAFANTDPGWVWHDTGYTVTNGEWTHIAVTYDNGTVTTYVNGNVVDVYGGSGSIGDTYPLLNELRIGGRSNNPAGKNFDGLIDDVRIWNMARTQGEIQASLDAVLSGGEAGLAGHWSFGEGIGSATADSTANANDGTLVDGGAGTIGPQWTGYVTDEDTPLNIAAAVGIIANDIDTDSDTLSVTQVNGSGANVGSTFLLPSGATLSVNAAGDFTYDPNGAFEYLDSGQRTTDTFTYQIDDGNGGTETAIVTITVVGVNDAPSVGTNTGTTVLQSSTTNVITSAMLSEGDLDDDGVELTYTVTTLSANGTLYLSGFGALGVSDTFTQDDLDAGKVSYDHDGGETTSDSFDFTLADGGEDGATPATGTFNFTITPVNDAPSFTDGSAAPGDDGIVTTDVAARANNIFGMTVQPDGKVLVVGQSGTGSGSDFALLRYHPNGSLDTSFGSGGVIITDIAGTADVGFDVTVQPDGKILISGQTYNGTDYDFAVLRYNSDGSLDASFGTGGIVTSDFGGLADFGKGISLQSDGKILMTGVSFNGTDYDFALVRYNTNGSLDGSFGTGGLVTTAIGPGDDEANDVAVQPDGKILVSGESHNGANEDFALVRYNADGSLDASFGVGGKVTTDFGLNVNKGVRFTMQPDGKILLAGQSHNGTDYDFALARYNTDGSLDAGFGTSGLVTTSIGAGNDQAYNVAVQADGKIIVSGDSHNGSDDDFAVVRYNSDGTLDTSFGTGGKVSTAVGAGTDKSRAFALQSDGKILLAGFSYNGSDNDIAVVRYNADGTLDTTFDATNTLDGNPTFVEGGAAVILDADVNVFDAELTALSNFSGATLTLARNGGANASDVYSATGNLSSLTQGGNLVLSGVTIGTVTTNSSGTLLLAFNASATQARVNEILQSIAYANSSDAPSAIAQINWSFNDNNSGAQGTGGALSATGSTTVSITATNDAPTLTALAAPVVTVNEDMQATITFADLQSEGNEADVDGTVTAFVVKGVSGGTLLVGTSVGTATAWAAGTNDTIDTTHKGYWTGAPDANGSLNAFTVVARDNGGQESVTPVQVQVAVTAVNDVPVRTAGTVGNLTVLEDSGFTTLGFGGVTYSPSGGTDETGQTLSYQVTAIPSASLGTVYLADGTTQVTTSTFYTLAEIQGMQFNTTANASGISAFQYSVFDSGGTANGGMDNFSEIVLITVTAVNDAPTIADLGGDSLGYNEADGAIVIEQGGNAWVSDVDSANFDTGTLSVSFQVGSDNAEDVLAIRNQGIGAGQIGVSGANVTYGGTTIGTFTGGSNGTPLSITFNANATLARVTALVSNITFTDTDTVAPTTGARTVRFVLTDGDGGTGANYDTTVTVNATPEYNAAGYIFEDVNGDGNLADQIAVDSVGVYLFVDGGDGLANGLDDIFVTSTTTDVAGHYEFVNLENGNYWVVVDSKTIAPSAGFNATFDQGDVWAEQTYGSAGALAADGSGGTNAIGSAGAAFGGRRGEISDNAASLSAAEHVTGVTIAGSSVVGVNSAFSFNVVTNVLGGDATDDDGTADRSIQGSLRQFIQNASAITGANAMRFVPTVSSNAAGGGGSWWSIGVTSVLPSITDTSTVIDGSAYSLANGTTLLDTNAGQLGAGGTVGVDSLMLSRVDRPEFEIVGDNSIATGLDVRANNATIRGLAIYGFGNGAYVTSTANILVGSGVTGTFIEDNIIGSGAAAFTDPGAGIRTGAPNILFDRSGSATVTNNLIGFANAQEIWAYSTATDLTITNNEIRGNGLGVFNWLGGVDIDGGANHLISGNLITDNVGPGVNFSATTGTEIVRNNTFSLNGIGNNITAGVHIAGGTGGLIEKNIISTNVGAGVLVASGVNGITISQNSINGNGPVSGQIGIDLLSATDLQSRGTSPFVTLNDSGDPDSGGNGLQNFPVLTSATAGASTTISGTLNSTASRTFRIEFFASNAGDPSGYGEGQRYLGFVNVTTDAGGIASFSPTLAAAVAAGEKISATATDLTTNDTSEFGLNVLANNAPVLDNSGTMTLNTITENQIGNSGQTVAAVVGSAGGDRITDVDSGAVEGIAIATINSGNGTWQYSINGGFAWNNVGAVSDNSALLLRSTDLIRFVPNTLTGTTADFTFHAWDQTNGTAGTKVDVTDNGGATPYSSAIEIATITVTSLNDEQMLSTNTGDTVAEGASGNFVTTAMLQTTDVDNTVGQLIYTLDAIPVHGTLYRNGVALNATDTFTQADIDANLITYSHDGSQTSSDSFGFTVDDGTGTTDSSTFNWTVTNVNDAPAESTIEGAPLVYTENDGTVAITSTLTIADVDDTSIESAVVQITGNYVGGEDVLAFTDTGSISGIWDGMTGTLTLTGSDTLANYEAALRNITYENTSEDPAVLTRTVSFTVNDGDVDSNSLTRDINVTSLNDVPAGSDNAVVTLEDTDYVFVTADFGFIDATEGHGLQAVRISTLPTNGILLNGVTPVSAGDSIAVADIVAGNLIFRPAVDAFGVGYDSFTFQVQDAGGTVNGGQDLDPTPNTITIDVTETRDITGTVLHDVLGDGDVIADPGVAGVNVHLYRDDGSGSIDAADVWVASSLTDASGNYNFSQVAGSYWVVVDSKDVWSAAGFNAGYNINDLWAEQTYGSAGALVADGIGGTMTLVSAGAAFGGRRADFSDDATTLWTAEHVTLVDITVADQANIDSGFSFNVVTNLLGGDAQDDDLVANRTVQGSLRQFITNANAMVGANSMRFVPAVPTNSTDGSGNNWWTVSVSNLLLDVTDTDTTISGIAYSFTDGVTVLDSNAGQVGTGGTVGVDGLTLDRVDRPELEIDLDGIDYGIVIDAHDATVENISIHGAQNSSSFVDGFRQGKAIGISGNVTGTGAALIHSNLIGTRADGSDPGAGNRTHSGLLTAGAATISHNFLAYFDYDGLATSGFPTINTEPVIVTNNELSFASYTHNAGDLINVHGSGAIVNGNYFHDIMRGTSPALQPYNGKAVEFWFGANNNLVENNTIDRTITAGIGLSANSAGNTIRRNIITGATGDGINPNSGAGILIATFADTTGTTGNTISENWIYNNNGLAIDIDSSGLAGGVGNGITLNDLGDGDPGANQQQNFPVITSAQTDGASIAISGTLNSAAGSTYRIEFFANTTSDAAGHGEAERYLGWTTVSTDGSGNATFAVAFMSAVATGEMITATATEDFGGSDYGSTSELAQNRIANEAPVIVSDGGGVTATVNVDENTTSVTTVAATDGNLADTPSFVITGGWDAALFNLNPLTGALTFASGADFEFPGDSDFDGVYQVEVTADDGNGGFDVQTINVTIDDVNEDPTDIAPNSFAIDENLDTTGGVNLGKLVAGDQDFGDSFTYFVVGGADAGKFSIGGIGGDELHLDDGGLDFETQSSYDVIVRVTDSGGLSYDENLTVYVSDLNDAPSVSLINLVTSLPEDADTSTAIRIADIVVADDAFGTYNLTLTGSDAAEFEIVGTELRLKAGASLDFETKTSFNVTVEVDDAGVGATPDDIALHNLNVSDVNEAPAVTLINVVTNLTEDTDTSTAIRVADILVTDDAIGTNGLTLSGADAADFEIVGTELRLRAGTVLDFETKTFFDVTVQVDDTGVGSTPDDTAAQTLNISDVNEAPNDIDPNSFSIDENVNTTGGTSLGILSSTDEDSGESFTYAIVGGADAARFSIGGLGLDELVLTDGFLDFETQSSYDVSIQTTDSGGRTYVENLTVNVNDLNENPAINDQSFAINENSPTGTSVGFAVSSDVDAGDSVTYSITGGTGALAFAINPGTGEITVADANQLDFETTPVLSLVVQATDTGGLTDTATLTINLNEINDEQIVITNLPLNVNEGALGIIDSSLLQTSDQDHAPPSLIYTITGMPAHGTILVSGIAFTTFTQHDIDNGRVAYQHDGSEATLDSFDFMVDDGASATSMGAFVISINGVNDAPVGTSETLTINEDALLGSGIDLLANDLDAEGDTLSISIVDSPDHAASFFLNANGSFSYQPAANYFGLDQFVYEVSDGNGGTTTATVDILVLPVNDAPIGQSDNFVTPDGTVLSLLLSVLGNDSDVESDPLTAIIVNMPSHGILLFNPAGSFTYRPTPGFVGVDTFTYIPNDGAADGAATLVSIDVTVAPPPDVDNKKIEPPEPDGYPDDEPDPKDKPLENGQNSKADDRPVTEQLALPTVLKLAAIDFDGEIGSLFEILANRQQASDVLHSILLAVDLDALDGIKPNVRSALAVSFDAKSFLWKELDQLSNKQKGLFSNFEFSVGAISAVATVGYIFWSLRGGVLIAAALSQMPNWRLIDPLPVLESYESKESSCRDDEMNGFFDNV